jgi:cell wall assembly regulator SMI1
LSDLWAKQTVTNGTTAVFLITWVPLLDSIRNESITIELDPSATENWIITYRTEDNNTLITTKSTSYIWRTIVTE